MHSSSLNVADTILDKRVVLVLAVFLLVNAAIIFAIPLLPFIDLPNHLAEATVYKYHDEPGNNLSVYYKPIPWFYPNTFHAVFCSLFPSVETGNKIFHVLYIFLFQSSLFLIIRKLNGNPWYGLLGLLFTYNYNITFGFTGFGISIPALLFLFYFILKDFEEGKIIWKICISVTLLLLYSMHAQNALLGLLLYGVLLLIHHRGEFVKAVITGTVVALPLIALITTWWMLKEDNTREGTFAFLIHYYSSEFWSDYWRRLYLPMWDHHSLSPGVTGKLLGFLIFVPVLLPCLYFRIWKMPLNRLWTGETRYLTVLVVICAACYFMLPDKLPGQSPLSMRFCTILMIGFILIGSTLLRDIGTRPLKVFVTAIVFLYIVVWGEYLWTFNRLNQSFNRDFVDIGDNNATMMGLIWNSEFRGRKVYLHFPNYYIVWHRGIAGSKIVDYRFGVVRRVVSEDKLPLYQEYAMEDTDEMRYESVDYFLAREFETPLTHDFFSNVKELRRSGPWVIYQNKQTSVSKVAGD